MTINRKIRMGMVGGGLGAFIGDVHRKAAALDGQIELVCGAFSRSADNSKATGEALFLDPDRAYASWEEMFGGELTRPTDQRMELVSIVTPNDAHLPVAKAALEAGFHVISDKPATRDLSEALDRHFAGPIEAVLSATGLLWVSSLLAMIGLYLLSVADSPASALVAATFWGIGVCFMWPTMLAQASARYPRAGAWAIGLIGSAGALSIQFVLPAIGAVYDNAKLEAAGGEAAFTALAEGTSEMIEVLAFAAKESFQTIALFPLLLLVVFGGLWIADRKAKNP